METMILDRLEKRLEEVAGLKAPIQTHFQLAVGTSAGGLNLLALFFKGWRAARCTHEYERLASAAFHREFWNKIPFLSALWTIWNNGLYPSHNFEELLRQTFGSETTLLDGHYARSIGARIAIPVARSPDPSLLLLNNYNGIGESAVRLGYDVTPNCDSVKVWETARCCTAAASFFRPFLIKGLGWLQDAGLTGNNPDVCFSEFRALYGPRSIPQFMINIGTGSSKAKIKGVMGESSPRARTVLGRVLKRYCGRDTAAWSNHFIPRLIKGYLKMLKGDWTWQVIARTVKQIPEVGNRCFRLDVDLGSLEPRLDDVESLTLMKEQQLGTSSRPSFTSSHERPVQGTGQTPGAHSGSTVYIGPVTLLSQHSWTNFP
ncbi:hypothetical protein HIM_12663 [Hirsutella minnesotensis 3608]|uniref:PNPLA domain-containing protein n=1 Tax=Hirsutella minnesotensis 3608 TaxID=1043627 RepID=A0A0F7ZZU5_9HYPO|nr:hypothetical protein HIM_12663 [Hirsutella minnesotensis 3608]